MKKKRMKDISVVNRSFVLTAVLYMLLGIILLIWHETVTEAIGYIIAGGMLVIGGGYVFSYFIKEVDRAMAGHDLVVGLLCVIVGIYAFINVRMVVGIIPTVLGFAVVFSGLLKVQKAVDAGRAGYVNWPWFLLVAAITCIIGILILADPFETASALIMLIGAGLIISGASDVVVTMFMGKILKNYYEELEEKE